MSTLIGIVSFLIVVAGFGAAYRVWEKRSTRRISDQPAPETRQTLELTVPTQSPTIPSLTDPQPPAAAAVQTPEAGLAEVERPLSMTEQPTSVTEPPTSGDEFQASVESSTIAEATPEAAIPFPESLLEDTIAPDIVPVESGVSDSAATISASDLSQAAAVGSEYLSEKIALAGRSHQLRQAPYLFRYANHADSAVRAAVATALGTIAANRRGAEVEAIVAILGKLSQDSKPPVRLQAVEGLGKIRSAIVLPWLQRAQRQSDSAVSQSAATAIQRLKFIQQAKKPVAQKPISRQGK